MRAILTVVVLLVASGCSSGARGDDATASESDARSHDAGRAYAGDISRGRLVFATNCATCHGEGGRSGGVGPSLVDESARQDLGRTIVWIENPDPPMPKLYPSPLSDEDVADVAAFVQQIK